MKINIYTFIIILQILSYKLCATDISYVQPFGGEVLQTSTSYTIAWDSGDTTGTIDILLWDGIQGIMDTIATDINIADKNYNWFVNNTAGEMYRLKIVCSENLSSFTMSAGYFTIEDTPEQHANEINESKTGFKDISTELKIYPNPASNSINLVVNKEPIVTIYIWDDNGRLTARYSDIYTQNFTINTSSYHSGKYYIECIMYSGKRITSKFMILQ